MKLPSVVNGFCRLQRAEQAWNFEPACHIQSWNSVKQFVLMKSNMRIWHLFWGSSAAAEWDILKSWTLWGLWRWWIPQNTIHVALLWGFWDGEQSQFFLFSFLLRVVELIPMGRPQLQAVLPSVDRNIFGALQRTTKITLPSFELITVHQFRLEFSMGEVMVQ